MSKTYKKVAKEYNDRNPFALDARLRKHGAHENKSKRDKNQRNWREWDPEDLLNPLDDDADPMDPAA